MTKIKLYSHRECFSGDKDAEVLHPGFRRRGVLFCLTSTAPYSKPGILIRATQLTGAHLKKKSCYLVVADNQAAQRFNDKSAGTIEVDAKIIGTLVPKFKISSRSKHLKMSNSKFTRAEDGVILLAKGTEFTALFPVNGQDLSQWLAEVQAADEAKSWSFGVPELNEAYQFVCVSGIPEGDSAEWARFAFSKVGEVVYTAALREAHAALQPHQDAIASALANAPDGPATQKIVETVYAASLEVDPEMQQLILAEGGVVTLEGESPVPETTPAITVPEAEAAPEITAPEAPTTQTSVADAQASGAAAIEEVNPPIEDPAIVPVVPTTPTAVVDVLTANQNAFTAIAGLNKAVADLATAAAAQTQAVIAALPPASASQIEIPATAETTA